MYLYSNHIYLPNQVKKAGYLKIEAGKIQGLYTDIGDAPYTDYSEYYVIPGFIDQHLHGWATGAFVHERSYESLLEMKRTLPAAGVTSFLPTTGAEPIPHVTYGIELVKHVMETQTPEQGSSVVGIHLEGPFVAESNAGMMAVEYFLEPSVALMQDFVAVQEDLHVIKLMTMAPELKGAKAVLEFCKEHGIQVSAGHSGATFDIITELKEFGIGGVTHMFSGMKGFHHRELGVAGTALYYDDLYCEFAKQTGMTVRPQAFQLAYKLKGPDRIIMTTDNTGLAQVSSERYHYIRKETFIPDGDHLLVRKDDGTEYRIYRHDYEAVKDLELSYIKSIQNLIKNVNPSVHDIIKMTSTNSSHYLGIQDTKGTLETGKDADIVIVDPQFNLKATYCMGALSYEDQTV